MKNVSKNTFDAANYSKKLWNEKLPAKLDSAIELTAFISLLQAQPEEAFQKYSNAIAIGNYRYSLVKATGVVTSVNEDDVLFAIPNNGSTLNVTLETEFIYGNALRDASGLVDVRDFTSTTDLNDVSQELNNMVRNEVLPPFKKSVKKGDKIQLTAAVQINKEHIKFDGLELIPLRIQILP